MMITIWILTIKLFIYIIIKAIDWTNKIRSQIWYVAEAYLLKDNKMFTGCNFSEQFLQISHYFFGT